MIVGDPSTFAIESNITTAYAELGKRALGLFVIHVGGSAFGVRAPDASLLACSFGEVMDRIVRRGQHTASFATDSNPGKIADAIRDALYAPGEEREPFFRKPGEVFRREVEASNVIWAPDGDEAFDDGSFVLHFDVGDRVRLIAFRSAGGYHHDPVTLRDQWLGADLFYQTLSQWQDAFESEWRMTPKSAV